MCIRDRTIVPGLHRPMPDIPLLKTLASLKTQSPPAIVTKEQNVAVGCAVLRILCLPQTTLRLSCKALIVAVGSISLTIASMRSPAALCPITHAITVHLLFQLPPRAVDDDIVFRVR